MAFKDAALEQQLKRRMRPDAHHFIRPDWRRFVAPGSDAAAVFELYERKYSPDQPRDDHGRWTSEGGGAGAGTTSQDTGSEPTAGSGQSDSRVLSDATPDNSYKPGAQLAANERGNVADADKILAEAKRIAAAGGASYDYCLAKCSPLLERFQRPGSDRNQWDFHKCMGVCLGR